MSDHKHQQQHSQESIDEDELEGALFDQIDEYEEE